MKKQFIVFLLRWGLNAFGLWIAVRLVGTGFSNDEVTAGFWAFVGAGLIFSLVNSILRPVAIILSLPAILFTLGLFTLVVNGLMVYISLLLTPHLHMTFLNSILTGIVLSLINYIVSSALELRHKAQRES
jgi:putative membrane protein